MGLAGKTQLERAELEAILQSGIFNRAPNLASFLRYICEQHFEGAADRIKEYNIAIEALGRSPDFDQKKDSIVRVEAHRLRKRLADYYQNAGLDRPVHIVIPNGQYAPQFLSKEAGMASAAMSVIPAERIEIDQVSPELAGGVGPGRGTVHLVSRSGGVPGRFRWHLAAVWLGGFLLVVAAVAGLRAVVTKGRRVATHAATGAGKAQAPIESWSGPATGPVTSEFRLIAGYRGPPFTDRQGRLWNADSHYTGGKSSVIPASQPIESLPDPQFPRSFRSGQFSYRIPLRQGTYELHLYFVEPQKDLGNGSEATDSNLLFRLSINGVVKLDSFDLLSEAGAPNRFFERVFKDISPGPDGNLGLDFSPVNENAILSALEILPSQPHRIRPVRIVARPNSVTDADGQTWMADRDFVSGFTVLRKDSVTNAKGWSLYESERYGNFAYRIALAPGKYRLTLHFAETWFGRPEALLIAGLAPTTPPFGLRIFNVFANGTALLRHFDIARVAGGAHRGIAKVFAPLEPNAQGLLILEFVPERNYACVNAIQVDEID